MDSKEIAAALVGGAIGYFLGSGAGATPKSDIAEYQKKIVLVCPLPEGGEVTLVPKPVYTFDMKGWKYGCVYLYMTPQGDVNGIVEVSKYYEDGRYEAEICRNCGGELAVYIGDNLVTTFPATSPGAVALGYYSYVFG